jgi:hypothetical protein
MFIVDHTFDILKNSGLSPLEIEFIKGLGAILYGKLQLWKNQNFKK